KQWRYNPRWTIEDAMRELEIKESILRDWKRRYWHQLDKIVPDDFVWAKMARPKRKMKLADKTTCEWRYSVFNTQSQQSSVVDCRIYIPHYMDSMSRNIVDLQPQPDARPRMIKDKVGK
ncbi:hypothetical protein PHYSODRAFT_486899, partial [Phytophthora sojae]